LLPGYYQGLIPVVVPINISNLNGLPKDIHEYSNKNGTFTQIKYVHNDYQLSNSVTIPAKRKASNKCNEFSYNLTSEWVKLTSSTVSQ
jgi:hypothetical protein